MNWSSSDSWMVTADHGGYVKYWQSNMNNVKMFQAHKEAVRALRWAIVGNEKYLRLPFSLELLIYVIEQTLEHSARSSCDALRRIKPLFAPGTPNKVTIWLESKLDPYSLAISNKALEIIIGFAKLVSNGGVLWPQASNKVQAMVLAGLFFRARFSWLMR